MPTLLPVSVALLALATSGSLATASAGGDPPRFAATVAGGFEAVHHRAGVRATVVSAGLELAPTHPSGLRQNGTWRARLATTTFGREGRAITIGAGTPEAGGERVLLARPALTEWFEARQHGIEQGWTIPEAPEGEGSLWIGVALEGDLSLRIVDDGSGAFLTDATGNVCLVYRELRAFDARGRDLPVQLRPSPWGTGIAVDDRGAVYPVTVDPLISSGWTFESDQASAFLDRVATAGDVNGDGYSDVIVASDMYDGSFAVNEGRVWVFHGSATGPALAPSWIAEGGAAIQFGETAVGIGDVNRDGYDDVAIGSRGPGNQRLFVYYGGAGGLGPNGTPGNADFSYTPAALPGWTPFPAPAGDVNGDGYEDVVVGTNLGKVLVFFGSASGLLSTPWEASYPLADPGACFGCAVAGAGDVNADGFADIVVGAYLSDLSGPTVSNVGRAYAYYGSAGFASDFTADWIVTTPLPPVAQVEFAIDVGTVGDSNGDGYSDVIVGARRESNGQSEEGLVHIYHGGPTGLATTPSGSRESNEVNGYMGEAVSPAGDIDADGHGDFVAASPTANGGLGSFHITHGRAGGVGTASTPGDQSILLTVGVPGTSGAGDVCGAGDVNGDGFCDVIVAADHHSSGQIHEGAALLYFGQQSTPLAELRQSVPGSGAEALGTSLVYVGDVNGDGRSDYAAGAPYAASVGRVTWYRGTNGLPVSAWTYSGASAGEELGTTVSGGDINDDGYSDLIIGAPGYNNGAALDAGRVLLFLGGPTGPAASPVWVFVGTESNARVGRALSSDGDVNNDGYVDILVGAQYFQGQNSGCARLFLGNATATNLERVWLSVGTTPENFYAASVSICGDVNRDGYFDLLIGSRSVSNGHSGEGRVYLHLGAPGAPSLTPAWVEESNSTNAHFGWSVGPAGDLNGDGYSDIAITAPDQNGFVGAVYAYAGAPGGPSTIVLPLLALRSGAPSDRRFGLSVAGGGDVDGDGFSDLAIGVEQLAAVSGGGGVLLFRGTSSGLTGTASETYGGSLATNYGKAVTIGGDVNGDGLSDVVTSSQTGDGDLNLFTGGGITASRHLPEQRRADDAFAISLLGRSESVTSFRSQGQSFNSTNQPTTAMGRERIRMEHEIAALGSLLDGLGTTLSNSWVDTGPLSGSAVISMTIAGLGSTNSYRWRERLLIQNVYLPHTRWLTIQGNSRQETKFGLGSDCNGNQQADGHDIQIGFSSDCNLNGIPDECDVAGGASTDCNNNASPDECDLFANDCDGNLVPDECQLPPLCPACVDCNSNSTVDSCDVTVGGMTDANGDLVPDACQTSGIVAFCFGNGTGTACPCGNAGAAGNGCGNSLFAQGANLGWGGVPAVSHDTFVLFGTQMPNSSALYFQGTGQQSGGAGSVFGDGLRCASGSVIRLGTKTNAGGASQYPVAGDLPISVRGAVPAIGGTRTYQVWYRNAAAFCTASTFNLSNGLSVAWVP